jgi:hypothetical protein
MRRREFLAMAGIVGVSGVRKSLFMAAPRDSVVAHPKFPDDDPKWLRTWDAALTTLAQNIKVLSSYDRPVLIEGAGYPGVWLECAPLEGLVYATLQEFVPRVMGQPTPAEIARANHLSFFKLQREDGQLPANIRMDKVGFGQIQMVVPIAATAWELVQQTKDEELLKIAYEGCSRWDAWLRRFRDTRKTGLVEGFCTYDTGMDNSPRWAGMPNSCPDGDARKCPPIDSLPRLCPDLSATVYGGRVALSGMALALGHKEAADHWLEDAEAIRRRIIEKLYCPEDATFYDLDAHEKFVRVRSVLIAGVLGEHVLKLEIPSDRRMFDDIWKRQLHNPAAFWPLYPIPSVAMDDPTFVRPIPENSWGGAAQALTALRTPRWMPHYGKQKELPYLMHQWVTAINSSGESHGEFWQQMNPATGEFTRSTQNGYSPAALVYLDFSRRLSHV